MRFDDHIKRMYRYRWLQHVEKWSDFQAMDFIGVCNDYFKL